MHTLTVRTKFTFGDRVRFVSPTQGCSGTGRIIAITIDDQRQIDYVIAIKCGEDTEEMQPGILEQELTLLGDAVSSDAEV